MVPFYPVLPAVALVGALICLITVAWFNPLLTGVFVAILALGYGYFQLTHKQREELPFAELARAEG